MGPFTRLQYVVSVALTIVLTGIFSSTIVFLVSILVSPGLILTVQSILELFGSLILGSLFFGGFGIFVSLRVKSSEALAATMNLMFFVFTFLSSVFYPSYSEYFILRLIFQINPLTYVADLVRHSLVGIPGFNTPLELVLLLVESIVLVYIASLAIRRIEL
jgi:ABC-2 type transport system permease protein